MKFILWDIDHTLMNATWRDGLLPKKGGSWDEYHHACVNDTPHENAVQLCRDLSTCGYQQLGITMRPDKYRALTKAQMITHNVPLLDVLMKDTQGWVDVIETKLTIIRTHFDEVQRRDIAFFIDDREDICLAVTAEFGISSFQVRHKRRS